MASNLVELAEMGISAETSTNINNTDNVKHTNSTKGYTLNIDRALRNKINACKKVNVDYNFTGGGITGEMDTATFELFRAACTTFYSRLPPEQGQCVIDMSDDKRRKAVVQQTYKVRREVGPNQVQGYTVNLYPTRNRILINGKCIDLLMEEHLPSIHELMMKPIREGIVTGASGLNHILGTQMQLLLDQRQAGIISENQLLPRYEDTEGSVTAPRSPTSPEPPKCSICKRVVRSRGVLCEKGQHWIHYRCDRLTPDEIDRLHSDAGFIFNCKQCSKDDTEVKVPVETKQNSMCKVKLELPNVSHDKCSQVQEILNEEQVTENTLECCVCGNRITDDDAIACLQCNINCHKACMEPCGIDYICLNCKSVDEQINTHENLSPKTDETLIQSETLTQTALNPPQIDSKANLTQPKTVTQPKAAVNQKANELEAKQPQAKLPTMNTKPVNSIDSNMKQHELRQWEQRLRKLEESLKLKELKQTDQDKDKQRLQEYINKLEARNDEL